MGLPCTHALKESIIRSPRFGTIPECDAQTSEITVHRIGDENLLQRDTVYPETANL